MPSAVTRPAKVTYWNSLLSVSTRHVYGHEPYCACGWVGAVHRDRSGALSEARSHNETHRKAVPL